MSFATKRDFCNLIYIINILKSGKMLINYINFVDKPTLIIFLVIIKMGYLPAPL